MTEAMTTAFSTALTTIQTDVTGMITTALPIALGLFGIGMALDGVKTSSQAWLHNGLRRTEKVSLGIIYNKLFSFRHGGKTPRRATFKGLYSYLVWWFCKYVSS